LITFEMMLAEDIFIEHNFEISSSSIGPPRAFLQISYFHKTHKLHHFQCIRGHINYAVLKRLMGDSVVCHVTGCQTALMYILL
jgi:hypothetical protein